MKALLFFFALFCLSLSFDLRGEESSVIPELVPFLEAYEASAKALAHEPHGVALRELNAKYLAALERGLEAARRDARLEDAVAITAERDALSHRNRLRDEPCPTSSSEDASMAARSTLLD